MNRFLNSLEDKLRVMEEEIKALPEELESILTHLDRGKLRSLLFRLNQDCDKLYDQHYDAQRNSTLVLPFILLPDGMDGPLIRPVTDEDLTRWRGAYKSEVRVIIGKGKVKVIAPSELAKEYKTTVSQIIVAAQQQGYIALGWGEYQNLLDEIGNLIGGDEKSLPGTIIGIPVTTTDSPKR